jgi:glycosyl transferase family 87
MPAASDTTRSDRRGLFSEAQTWVIAALIAFRALVVVMMILDATKHEISDPDVQRAEQIATSPARPYRDFPVEYMPLETAMIELIGGDGFPATAIRLALISFAGDLAAAAGVAWGWGRRPMAVYLFLGLPLLSFIYQRFDPVSVAFAVWAMALLTKGKRDGTLGGVAFGFAIFAKLWAVVLLPVLLLKRAWHSIASLAVVAFVGGATWYLVGGPKAPFQVLSFRGATGWSVESTVGNIVWIVSGSQIGPQAGAVRVGSAPAWSRAALTIAILALEAAVWWRAAHDDRDPAGATAVAAVIALLVCSPLFSTQYVAWVVPWAAIALEGDRRQRDIATLAALVIAVTGLLHLSYLNSSPLSNIVEKWVLFLRNMTCIGLLAVWLRPASRATHPEPTAELRASARV